MSNTKLSFESSRQISIVNYLSRLGFEPAKVRGADHWYHSPFREERAPSFKVNAHLNLWFDHGTGAGGSIIDLGMKLFSCSPREFLQRLTSDNLDIPGSLSGAIISSLAGKPSASFPSPAKLSVLEITKLTDRDLITYLNSRSIPIDLAQQYCKQIRFQMNEREYSAIGFPNQAGAWELRNHWFKGSSSPKDISLVRIGDPDIHRFGGSVNSVRNKKLSVLEGFIDFLSVVQLKNSEFITLTKDSDFLILNSLRLLNRIQPLLQQHKEVNLLLDNDQPATDAKAMLKDKGVPFIDASALYLPHKDVNEYLVASKATKQSKVEELEPSPLSRRHRRKTRMRM